jgi:hypothetical protein
MSNILQVGQRVKCFENFGTISAIKERHSPVVDDMRTFVSIDWDSEGEMDHVLSEFKRHGGPIEEIQQKEFVLYYDHSGVGVVEKGKITWVTFNQIELNEFDLRRLICSCEAALSNAGLDKGSSINYRATQ